MKDVEREAKERLTGVDNLLKFLMSDGSENSREALTSFLWGGEDVVAVELYGMSIDDIFKVFSSEDVDMEWKRRRLMTFNCGECLPCTCPVEVHTCAWVPWYPLEFADDVQRWSRLGRSGEDPEEEFVNAALVASTRQTYGKLLADNPNANEAKLLFRQIAKAENKREINRVVKFIGQERVSAILDADGGGMFLSLFFLLGMTRDGYCFESKGSVCGVRWLVQQRPNIATEARDRFGNNAQHYLLAGYGRMAAPCYAGSDNFCWEHMANYRRELRRLGCDETVKNNFGFSVADLMARSEAPRED